MSGPTRPRARGAPRQLLPLTLGAWKSARAPAQLLLPVARLCGRGPAVPPAPGAEVSGHRSAAVGTARVPSRPPLPRPARLEQLCPTSPSGPRPPRVAAAPARLTHARGLRAVPPRRRRLRAAFPAPFSFASRLLPAPPAPQPGRGSGPARVPRGFRREDGAVSPLMPPWEAAGTSTSASPLCAPTRGRGARSRSSAQAAGQRQLLGRELRGPSGLACGAGTGRQGLGSAVPTCTEDTDSQGAGQTPTSLRLRQPHGHGNGRRRDSACRDGGTRSASDPQSRFPRRAVPPVLPALYSTKHLPRNGVQ